MNVPDPVNRARGLLATFGRVTAVQAVGNGLVKATFTSPEECQRALTALVWHATQSSTVADKRVVTP